MKNTKLNNLVIGNTSQLAHYFPNEYEKISSRNINFDDYKNKFYDRIFLCFAEQRTFLGNDTKLFFDINVDYTTDFISYFKKKCNKIIVYGTAELWNNYEGPISIDDKYNYNITSYIASKSELCNQINNYRENNLLNNCIVIHPFNFNSTYRKDGFLFSKIFDSIINEKKIEIGDTYFYRDLVHPKYVVERSIEAEKDEIVGSGRLIHVNDFIRDLYHFNFLDYDDYVTENYDHNLSNKRKIYYLKSTKCNYDYQMLLSDTIKDIHNARIQNKTS